MKRTQEKLTCDVCGAVAVSDGEPQYGGHPFNDWFHISRYGGATSLKALVEQRKWPKDICSMACLRALLEDKR